ncbi:hypothetical protein [Mesorhizobium sp.]|uniref:hypothetical protein n=1 Tax=Mesorhizobium sp. TaxID=1871066 RepID=UPI001229D8BA|nr:hypothetical protein [Mesorhizobium sp.]TIS45373.1 MAG: hypothetical protein E5W96_32060 [Mesorhizobium sp.]
MPLMSVLRTLVVGLTVMSCAVIATSASARDRPGTPTDPQIYGGLGLGVTVIWKNTAGTVFTIGGIRPELVGFEVEMTKNGNKYAPPISGLPREVGANWNPSFFEYHTTPNQVPTSPINIVGFTIKEVDPNTKYCFRVRARRKSDDVVSANWSGTSCVTTGSPPTKPIKHTCRAGDRGACSTGETPWATICVRYAMAAVKAVKENGSRGCGGTGAQWASSGEDYIKWCMSHKDDMRLLDMEAKARSDALAVCGSGTGNASGGGDRADNSCGGGTATVVINQPGLDRLNVRNGPDGQVTGTVPEGQAVSVTGPCGGTGGAAGIIASKQSGGDGGWCRISAPVSGCVSSRFLKFGGGAAGFAKSAAGFAKPKEKQISASAAAGFGGSWSANADNVAYDLSLQQNGNGVSGRYQGDDGSAGQITGKVSGNVLRFSWVQKDGTRGSGKFTLAADGQSFAGSYNFGNNPDVVEGSWNGTRQ